MNEAKETGGTIQVIDRMFSITEYLSTCPKGASLADISGAVGLPKSTISRILSSLIARGYAAQSVESKQYHLSMRMFEIGSRVVGSVNLLAAARPYLERLSDTTGEAVHLVARVGDDVVYLFKEEATASVVRMSSCVGLHNPMYCTGVGKSILAYLPQWEFEDIWSRTKPVQFTPTTIMTKEAMQAEIAIIRQHGYAIDNEEHEPGVRCVAVPIKDFDGQPVAAISVSAPAERMPDEIIEKYAVQLKQIATEVEKFYGVS
jgi:DNA-binding IclR family transcriptional regulator